MLGKLIGKGSDGEVYELAHNKEFVVKYIQPEICGICNYLEYYIMLYNTHPHIVKAKAVELTKHNLVKIIQPRAISELNDFSLCRFTCSTSNKQLYTYHYRPPEVDTGQFSLKSDIYALGCTMYEIYFHEPYHNKIYQSRIHYKRELKGRDKIFLDLIYNMTSNDDKQRYGISQIKSHPYFNNVLFPEYGTGVNHENIIEQITRKWDSPVFIAKCMNKPLVLCVDYKSIDQYTSTVLKFQIIDLFQK